MIILDFHVVAGSLMNDRNGFEMTSFDTLQKICDSTEPALSHALCHASSCSCRVHTRYKWVSAPIFSSHQDVWRGRLDWSWSWGGSWRHVIMSPTRSWGRWRVVEEERKTELSVRTCNLLMHQVMKKRVLLGLLWIPRMFWRNGRKYICQYEWELIPGRSNEGKGDLVLSNGTMFLLVETQYLTSLSGATECTKRTHKRGEIREACVSVFSLLCFHSSLLAPSRRSLTRAHIWFPMSCCVLIWGFLLC